MARSRLAVIVVVAGLLASVSPASAADPSTAPSPPPDTEPANTPPSNDGATVSGSTTADISAASASGFPPAIITNGTVLLGVNPEGHLNVDGGSQSSGMKTTWVGVRYVPTNADAIAPGCRCEGWGVADSIAGVSGWASVDNAGISPSLQVLDFSRPSLDSARSIVQINSPGGSGVMLVSHLYRPSAQTPNAYTAYVAIDNISANPIRAVYRRVMDWDVEPTAFNEYVTFVGNSQNEPWLKTITNNGFDHPDPLRPPQAISGAPAHTGEGTDIGPHDHGALFDFDFGELGPGERIEFKIFYGAAADEAGALDALTKVQTPVYSIGEPATDPATGTPNTFFFGFGRPDCTDILSGSDQTPAGTRPGKTNIKVSYDPRTLVDRRRADWAAAATGIARSIRTDMERAFDRYQALGLTVPSFVDVEIRCDLFLAVPALPITAPAVVEADNKIKIRTAVVQEAFRDALAAWNGTDELIPTAYLQNWINDHEPFHAIHAGAKKVIFTNVFDAVTQARGHDHTNWESGAVLGSDLMADFDDVAGTNYLGEVENLLRRRQPAELGDRSAIAFDSYNGDIEYDAASVFQYFAERSRSDADLEQRSANFLKALVNSKQLREGGLREATAGLDPFDLLRDYFVTAWIRHAPPPPVSNPAVYQFLDETQPRTGSTTAPEAYPDYFVHEDFVTALSGASATTPDRTIKHGQAAIEVVTLPAGSQKLAVRFTTSQGAAPRLAFVPFNGDRTTPPTSAVGLRDEWLKVGPAANLDQTTIVDASGFANLAVIVVSSQDDLRYHVAVQSLADLTPTLSVLKPAAGSFVDIRSPGLGDITIDVDPRVGGELIAGWHGSDFIVRVDGQPVRVFSATFADDHYRIHADGPGGLADGFHDLSVEFRGVVVSRAGGLLVSSPNTDPGSTSTGGSFGSMGQGETAATTAIVAPGATAASFTLAWQGSDFDLQLTSPSGRVITETTIAADVTVTQAPTTVTIQVAAPESGEWQVQSSGVVVPAPESVTYSVVEFGTPMRAYALATGTGAGLPIAIRVPVHDSTAATVGATVWASIADPSGFVRRFPLTDDGRAGDAAAADGVYSTEAWGTDQSGTYTISVDVAGVAEGAAFTRHETATVALAAKVDSDGDGVADAAEARFGLSPSVATDGAEDADFDGLSVADELRNATDPTAADTDGGGEADASEVAAASNPRDRGDDGRITPLAFAAVPLDGGLVRLSATSAGATGSLSIRRIGPTGETSVAVPLTGTAVIDGPLPDGQYTYVATLVAGGVTAAPLVVGPVTVGADVTPPMADLEVNDGAFTTDARNVVLRFANASEPLVQMRIASSPTALATAPWVPFSEVSDWELSPSGGVQRIYAQVRDRAGFASPQLVGGIELQTDTTPPVSSAGALSATYTTTSLSVPYSASDEATGVASVELWARFRLNEAQAWGGWSMAATATASPFTYTFTQGDGNYEFYTIAVDGAGNREASPSTADAATRRDTVDDPPDFNVTLDASKPQVCTSICPTGARVAAAPVKVTLNGFGTAVDDRSTIAVAWRLFGVKSDGTSKRLFDFRAAVPSDGSFDSRLESFETSDQRADAGYKWYDVEIKVTAGTLTTSRVIRVEIRTASGGTA